MVVPQLPVRAVHGGEHQAAVDRGLERLPHAAVAERRFVRRHDDVREGPAGNPHRIDAREGGDLGVEVRAHVPDHVHLLALEGGELRRRLGEHLERDRVEVRQPRPEVTGEPLDRQVVARHELLELERARAELPRGERFEVAEPLARDDPGVRHGHGRREVRGGRLQREPHRVLVHGFHAVDRTDLAPVRRGGLRVEDRLDGRDDVVGRDLPADVELHALAESEGPHARAVTGRPRLGEVGHDLALGVEPGEVVVHPFRGDPLGAADVHDGAERAESERRADAEHAAVLLALRVGGRRDERRRRREPRGDGRRGPEKVPPGVAVHPRSPPQVSTMTRAYTRAALKRSTSSTRSSGIVLYLPPGP